MKNLGLTFGLLVSALGAVSANAGDSSATAEEKLLLALNADEAVQAKVELKTQTIELDQTSVLAEANNALEQQVNAKLDAILASKLQALETDSDSLAQN